MKMFCPKRFQLVAMRKSRNKRWIVASVKDNGKNFIALQDRGRIQDLLIPGSTSK